jgi:propionate CoA-transferase
VTMEQEAIFGEMISMAQATRRAGGVVVVQVKRIANRGTLPPKQVKIPGMLVDLIVVDPDQTQTFVTNYSPAYAGELRVPLSHIDALPFGPRKVIARRAALELFPEAICNLGSGISTGIASLAAEEGALHQITLTNEQGLIGGAPATGNEAGASRNFQAMIDQPYQFDFYDGGGLDLAFLSFAEVDEACNVNVSRFGDKIIGVGGFINISQNARRLVFVGTFAAPSHPRVEDGRLVIDDDRAQPKFVAQVEQRTFSGPYAAAKGQPVLYVTERCVFELTPDGLELTELAPGLDLERDVLGRMGFAPIVRGEPTIMDARIFGPQIMGLKEDLLAVPLEARFSYDEAQNLFFLNLEGLSVVDAGQMETIHAAIDDYLAAIGRKVYAIVNYDNVYIAPDLMDAYTQAAHRLNERYYAGVTRYTTSSFMRLKLGHALAGRDVAPHIHETLQEATSSLTR